MKQCIHLILCLILAFSICVIPDVSFAQTKLDSGGIKRFNSLNIVGSDEMLVDAYLKGDAEERNILNDLKTPDWLQRANPVTADSIDEIIVKKREIIKPWPLPVPEDKYSYIVKRTLAGLLRCSIDGIDVKRLVYKYIGDEILFRAIKGNIDVMVKVDRKTLKVTLPDNMEKTINEAFRISRAAGITIEEISGWSGLALWKQGGSGYEGTSYFVAGKLADGNVMESTIFADKYGELRVVSMKVRMNNGRTIIYEEKDGGFVATEILDKGGDLLATIEYYGSDYYTYTIVKYHDGSGIEIKYIGKADPLKVADHIRYFGLSYRVKRVKYKRTADGKPLSRVEYEASYNKEGELVSSGRNTTIWRYDSSGNLISRVQTERIDGVTVLNEIESNVYVNGVLYMSTITTVKSNAQGEPCRRISKVTIYNKNGGINYSSEIVRDLDGGYSSRNVVINSYNPEGDLTKSVTTSKYVNGSYWSNSTTTRTYSYGAVKKDKVILETYDYTYENSNGYTWAIKQRTLSEYDEEGDLIKQTRSSETLSGESNRTFSFTAKKIVRDVINRIKVILGIRIETKAYEVYGYFERLAQEGPGGVNSVYLRKKENCTTVIDYTYDDDGNRIGKDKTYKRTVYSYDKNGRCSETVYSTIEDVAYDKDGNVLNGSRISTKDGVLVNKVSMRSAYKDGKLVYRGITTVYYDSNGDVSSTNTERLLYNIRGSLVQRERRTVNAAGIETFHSTENIRYQSDGETLKNWHVEERSTFRDTVSDYTYDGDGCLLNYSKKTTIDGYINTIFPKKKGWEGPIDQLYPLPVPFSQNVRYESGSYIYKDTEDGKSLTSSKVTVTEYQTGGHIYDADAYKYGDSMWVKITLMQTIEQDYTYIFNEEGELERKVSNVSVSKWGCGNNIYADVVVMPLYPWYPSIADPESLVPNDPKDQHPFVDNDDDLADEELMLKYWEYSKKQEDQPYLPFYSMFEYQFDMFFEYGSNGELASKKICFKGYDEQGDLLYQFDGTYFYDENGEFIGKDVEEIGDPVSFMPGYILNYEMAQKEIDLGLSEEEVEIDNGMVSEVVDGSDQPVESAVDTVLTDEIMSASRSEKSRAIMQRAMLAERDNIQKDIVDELAKRKEEQLYGLVSEPVHSMREARKD